MQTAAKAVAENVPDDLSRVAACFGGS